MSLREKIIKSRNNFSGHINRILQRGFKPDDEFWETLTQALILSDLGGRLSCEVVETLQEKVASLALDDMDAVLELCASEIAKLFAPASPNPINETPVCMVFVGVNGAGKTTCVGKLAFAAAKNGRKVLIGAADTFRAAAIEQLDIWAKRANVELVSARRGADPASVCYDTLDQAQKLGSDYVLIDTSGRLHSSDDLMRQLRKLVSVCRKHATAAVRCILVIDAITGQNGLSQAREFNRVLDLDGVIITKLDGTAKGGIAAAISHELSLPVLCVGVGEGIKDLYPFDPDEYAYSLFGART